jgi:uncharacterized protein DUF6869
LEDALGVTTAEEEVIRAECEEWAGGLLYMDSNESRDGLRDRICADPDAWWHILQELIAHAPDDQVIQRLAYAPLRMTLECGGERLLREAVSIARTSPRMASAVKGWPSRPTNKLYPFFGRAFVVETLIRHYSQPTGFDFWSWEMARDLIEDDPAEAWLFVVALVNRAHEEGVLHVVAAGELEEFLLAHAADFIDRIEEEARGNSRFKSALSYLYVWKLSPELFDRIQAAAGVQLTRRPGP